MNSKGQGVEQNLEKAVQWYMKSAKNKFNPAQYNLGILYSQGKGVPQDDTQAYMWFSIAAANGNKNAKRLKNKYADKIDETQKRQANLYAQKLNLAKI